ncbi:hypothetical protein [Synechococcus sp. CS-205]|uniref:hypothetical protein n=1 Tax=Synechococcus sp. CS-205 TaxID=2847984 RepID=UPI00223BD357|nr:hypothetical protein [Synechococcus sp. CS-205]MCT0248450.1 hypothetical protein [Synechococcus sp. CS-205]
MKELVGWEPARSAGITLVLVIPGKAMEEGGSTITASGRSESLAVSLGSLAALVVCLLVLGLGVGQITTVMPTLAGVSTAAAGRP